MSTQTIPWQQIADQLDPMMSKEEFDTIRDHYFRSMVAPRLASKGLSVSSGREEFFHQTERKPILEGMAKTLSPLAMQGLQASSTFLKTLEAFPIKGFDVKKLRSNVDEEIDALDKLAQREGFSLTFPRIVGEVIGMTPAFLAGEAAGARLAPMIIESAAILRASEAISKVTTRAIRSGSGFATYEGLAAENENRVNAAMKGFAVGAALDLSLTGAGALAKKIWRSTGVRITKEEAEKIFESAARGETQSPPIDRAVTEVLGEKRTVASRTPLANFIFENTTFAGKIRFEVKFGDKPIYIEGPIANIASISKTLVDQIDAGAEFTGVAYSPEYRSQVFNHVFNSLGRRLEKVYGRPFTVLTKEGQEVSLVQLIESNRLAAEVVGPGRVQVQNVAVVEDVVSKPEDVVVKEGVEVDIRAAAAVKPEKLPPYSLTTKPSNEVILEQIKATGLPTAAERDVLQWTEVVWDANAKPTARIAASQQLHRTGLEALVPTHYRQGELPGVRRVVEAQTEQAQTLFEQKLEEQIKEQRSRIKFMGKYVPDSERYEYAHEAGFLIRRDKETDEVARVAYDQTALHRLSTQKGRLFWLKQGRPSAKEQLWSANLTGRNIGVIEEVRSAEDLQAIVNELSQTRGWGSITLKGFEPGTAQVLYFKTPVNPQTKRAIQLWDSWLSFVRGDKTTTLGNISRTLTDSEHRFVAGQMGIPEEQVEAFLRGKPIEVPGTQGLVEQIRNPLASVDPLVGHAPVIKYRPGRGYYSTSREDIDLAGFSPLQAEAATTSLASVMERYGVRAVMDPATPIIVTQGTSASREIISHELYHTVMRDLPGVLPGQIIADVHKPTVLGIVKNFLEKMPVYRGAKLVDTAEEAFVWASNAVRYGDDELLKTLGDADAGIENVIRFVRDTADDMWRRFKTYDSPLSRIGQRRMRDLVRRTDDDLVHLIRQDVEQLGGEYIPSAEGFLVRIAGKTYRFHEPSKVYDFLLEFEAGLDIAPQWGFRAQAMGMRGPIVPPGMEPSGRTPPLPEVVVDDIYEMGALRVLEAMGRPMKSWVNSIHTSINAAYKQKGVSAYLPLSEKWNAVDEQVRNSLAWWQTFTKDWESIFKEIKSEQTKKLFRYVQAGSDTEKAIVAARLKITPQELLKAQEWERWAKVFATDTGISPTEGLRHIQKLEAFPEGGLDFVFGPLKPPSKMSFWENAFRRGSIEAKDDVLSRYTWQLGRLGREKKFLEEPLREFDSLLNLKDEEGKYILGNIRWPLANYSKYIKGLPDMSQQILTRAMGGVFELANQRIAAINKLLPSQFQVPKIEAGPKRTMDNFLLLMYGAGLGLRPAVLMRDSMHMLLTNLPTLGARYFWQGVDEVMRNRKMWDGPFHKYQVSLKESSFGELYADLFEEAGQATKGVLGKLRWANEAMLTPQRHTTNFGREVAFVGQARRFRDALNRYRSGEINAAKFIEESGMDLYDVPARSRFLAEASKPSQQIATEVSRGLTPAQEVGTLGKEQVTKYLDDLTYRAAAEYVDLTQWGLRRGTQPVAMQTGIGRIFGQFGTWPLSYLDFMGKVLTRGTVKKRIERMAYWTAVNYGAVSAFEMIGADAHHWFWQHSAGFTGSPTLQAALDVPSILEGTDRGRQARGNLLRFPLMFVPGSVAMRNWIRAVNESGGGWEALENPRFWGFRPLKEIQEDPDLTEWFDKEFGI